MMGLSWEALLLVFPGHSTGLHAAGCLAGAETPSMPLSTWTSSGRAPGSFHSSWLPREKKGKLLIFGRSGLGGIPESLCTWSLCSGQGVESFLCNGPVREDPSLEGQTVSLPTTQPSLVV